MKQWDREMQIEQLNEMLITLSILAIRYGSAAADEVNDYRGKIIEYVKKLTDEQQDNSTTGNNSQVQ